MFFSYTKSDFDCEYIALNPLIFKSVYTLHNVSSDVIVGVFGRVDFGVKFDIRLPQNQRMNCHKFRVQNTAKLESKMPQ